MTKDALDRLTLTPSDAGQGWKETSTGASDANKFPSCVGSGPNPSIGRTRNEVVLVRQSDNAYLYESVEPVSTVGGGNDLAKMRNYFDSCSQVTLANGGTTFTGTITPTASSKDDRAAGYDLTFSESGTTITFEMGLVEVNGYLVTSVFASPVGTDHSLFQSLTSLATAKVRAEGKPTA